MSSRHILFPSGTAAHWAASNSTVNSTVHENKLKEGSSPEHEEEEDRGDEELMKSVKLRPNNTLVSILKPVEYLIRDLIKNRYMTQRNDDGVPVMEKMSLRELFRGVFQIQIYQDLNNASEVWCSVQHKLTKKYLSVSCRRSINFTELVLSRSLSIPDDDDDDNNTISLEMAGNHSGTDKVNLSESFPSSTLMTLQHCPAPQSCLREESAQIPPESFLWGFDPNQGHVCLAPKKFPNESLSCQEKDGRVVLVDKAGFKAFKCVVVNPKLRKQIEAAKFCAILRFMHNLFMGLGAED